MVVGHSWVIHPNGRIRAIMAPPLNDFLQKGILWTSRKEVTIEVAGLGIKENEDGHGSGLWNGWRVHGRSVPYSGGFKSIVTEIPCRKFLGVS